MSPSSIREGPWGVEVRSVRAGAGLVRVPGGSKFDP